MRLIDADALREQLSYRFFDITAVPATAVVDAAPTICCERCRYAEDEAMASGLNELHKPGTNTYSCRNGVCWYRDDPEMNPEWFGCSIFEEKP